MTASVKHHIEFIDLGKYGSLEATRDDTDEQQDYHLTARKNGRKVHEIRAVYNIQYDYFRYQEWWRGKLLKDRLLSGNGYGHLLYEYSLQPPPGWRRPKKMWEQVTPLGTQMFRLQGMDLSVILVDILVSVHMCFYDLKYYKKSRFPAKLLGDVEIIDKLCDRWFIDTERRELREHVLYRRGRLCLKRLKMIRGRYYGSWTSQIKRLRFYKKHREEIGVDVPIDRRMVY